MVDIEAARAKLLRAAIRRALYSVWPRPLGAGLIMEAIPDDLICPRECIDRALYYLVDKGTCEPMGHAGATPLYRLTPDGVDRVESDETYGLDRARLVRMLRLRCLQALDLGRPQPMGLSLISISLAQDTDLDLSEPSIRRALAYLGARNLATAAGETAYRITAEGIDYLSGDGGNMAGVARPFQW